MEITKDVGKKSVTFFDFKGLMAPVFTCFNDDERKTINISYVDRYAKWLKSKNIDGVLVNGITGEGPSLGLLERKLNAECWWRAASENSLMMMLQIGGGALPDVLEMGCFAEELGIDSVCCLPEIFYKPRNIDQLIAYCKVVAKTCPSRPFFYYHIPRITNVNLNMVQFCNQAEECITNFYGLCYNSADLDMAQKCKTPQRIIIMGMSEYLGSCLMLGFDTFITFVANIKPEVISDLLRAFKLKNLPLVQAKQNELMLLVATKTQNDELNVQIADIKNWFNERMLSEYQFSAGPTRGACLDEMNPPHPAKPN
ncbi:N-acetylneuraminate lyase B-like isoform 1-T3 [Glossina fuscipes fuscipes]